LPFGAAISVHPVSSHATGEVIGQVIEELGVHPDAAILLATPGHAGALEDVAHAIRRLLSPTVLVGATVSAVIGQGADDQGGPALALWAGMVGPVRAFSAPADVLGFDTSGLVVLSSGPLPDRVGEREVPPTVGAAGLAGPLVLDDRTHLGGTVGIAFGAGVHFETAAAQGWRAIGPVLVVTESDPSRGLVVTLDDVPALERLQRMASDEVPAEEVPRINRQLGLGAAGPDAPAGETETSPVIYHVRGADRANGAVAAGALEVGTTVRFWVRGDPAWDLRRTLVGHGADAVLAFAADPVSRGYGPTDLLRDAETVTDALGVSRLAGLVAPTQLGPGGAFGGAATLALFSDR
jgi:small ligand-binding sensory domain FIST